MERYRAWMAAALALARAAAADGEVPVGALVISPEGEVIGRGRNARQPTPRIPHDGHDVPRDGAAPEPVPDPTAHAEVVAIRQAAATLGTARLDDCTLVVTLEPCVMCAGAALQARIGRIVFGAWDVKAGAVGGRLDVVRDGGLPHRVEVVGGIREEECVELLRDFFQSRR